ncbi:CBP3-like protein [Zymoseptoria brevis]|uniref:CBP3-like protein n=1 Tax=Zymoseptoria brevis TaxID=1047168 RepID=A0A0F4GX18_9PEZI|nr:CBP3-like protein [Zymoseptoria brevis]
MSTKSICSSCLRTVRQQSRSNLSFQSAPKQHLQRTFTTTTTRRAAKDNPLTDALNAPAPPASKLRNPSAAAAAPPIANLAAKMRSSPLLRSTTEPYIAYGATADLYAECARQCSYTVPSALENPPALPPMNAAGDHLGSGTGWWFEPKSTGGLGLEVTFTSWAQVIYLHMWLLTVRLRCFPAEYVKDWHQNLLDHFFYAAEDRMAVWHGMTSRGARNKALKDLYLQWRGVQLGYDEGLTKGDAVMAAAVWRNVFKAEEGVDLEDLALVVVYMRRELQRLSKLDDETITTGQIKFEDPKDVRNAVTTKKSPFLGKAFTPEELKAADEAASEQKKE